MYSRGNWISNGNLNNNEIVNSKNMQDTNDNDDINKNDVRCFVCDVKVQGRYYSLATCKTQNSRSRVIEKLGELVGERYLVVISEDDVICRSCANLINTLDRLETEMRYIRDNILRFLEQKYSLKEGELLDNSEKPKLCQPPQITKCNGKEITNCCVKQSKIEPESYAKDKKRQKRIHSWLQCDKCKYTTPFRSFIMHHLNLKDHIKQKTFSDKCPMIGYDCSTAESENKENGKGSSGITTDNSKETSFVEKTTQQIVSLVPNQVYTSPKVSDKTIPPLTDLSNFDHLYVPNVLSSEDNPTSSRQPIYIRVLQQIDMNDIEEVNEIDDKMTRISKSNFETASSGNEVREQILTAEGNLDMDEVVYWNETRVSDTDSTITFQ